MTAPDVRELIDTWMQTADWESSQAYLRAHASVLMSDEVQGLLRKMAAEESESPDAEVHADLLAECRAQGIEAGYAAVLEALAEEQDAALLRALVEVRDSDEMARFAQTLTVNALERLIMTGDAALGRAAGPTANGLRQRLEALKAMREQLGSPLWRGLRAYLNAESDVDSEAVLLADPALLLSVEAEQALDGMTGGSASSHARLLAKRALWRRVRAMALGA